MFYTQEQRDRALELYDKTNSIAKVIHILGYPSKPRMNKWISIRNGPKRESPEETVE
jgi:putative transposase